MKKRKVAVLRNTAVGQMPAIRHFVGEMTSDGSIDRAGLPTAQVLIPEEASVGKDTGYFLYRFTKAGDPAGDTWHATEAEAFAEVWASLAIGYQAGPMSQTTSKNELRFALEWATTM